MNTISKIVNPYDHGLNQFPGISVRLNTLSFNSKLWKEIGINKEEYVVFSKYPADKSLASATRLYINFKEQYEGSSYPLKKLADRSGTSVNGGWIACKWLVDAMPALQKASQEADRRKRFFKVSFDKTLNSRYIKLQREFESVTSDTSSLPEKPGVYRLINKNEIVYIGSTNNLKRRIIQHKTQKNWVFDKIEFFEVLDGKESYWESYHENQFVEEHGSLPRYGGQRNNTALTVVEKGGK